MNQRDKITELLENYRLYKLAIRDYEKPDTTLTHNRITEHYFEAAPCRIVGYSDMPMGTGSGSRAPKITGGWSWDDHAEYHSYKMAVNRMDSALDLLTDEERSVVTLKWMDKMTFEQIGKRKSFSRDWVKKTHKRAISKLSICLRFDDVPNVEVLNQPA